MDKEIKILIVDDDDNLRETLADLLEIEDYKVFQARNSDECMDLVATEFFNIILMDYNLPGETGLSIIKKIRAFNAETQILMVTAHASLNAMMQAMQESVYDFLIKPVDFDYLKRTIKRALDKYFLEQSNRELLAQLKKSNEDLKKLDNMKSKFFSIVSHDLSNSLMGLKMSFEMFVKKTQLDDDQRKRIALMQESIGQISHLIKDLVDWAAIEKGQLRVLPAPCDLTGLVESTVELFKDKAMSSKGILVSFVSTDDISLNADEKRIRQVLSNLLENAVRHTPDNGMIEVKVAKFNEKNAKVSVKDNGDGISPENASKLFESFSQIGEKGKVGRLGLGLSISKEIIQNHGGKIWAESEGLGKGTIFSFTLPLQN
ncbi:Signal transduction histidine kinase [Parelusimicrobium proximum]|uniref:sensor histidine kinase n=1 Tax=Parelusimicrobium proximum TaxID=3228953 RepID=UPI003D186D4A